MLKRYRLVLVVGLALLLVALFTSQAIPRSTSQLVTGAAVAPMAFATSQPTAPAPADSARVLSQAGDVERLIVRTANLTITVDDPAAKLDQIEAMAAEYGGWVVMSSLNVAGTGDQQRVTGANINIRVQAARLDDALGRIKADVDTVNAEAVSGEDVTAQYVDIRSRVANLEAAERQLQSIMDDAQRTEDVLAVFSQLTQIRGDIESLRGQMQYFEQASAYSLVQVMLFATPVTPTVEVGGWRPLDAVSGAAQSLVNVLQQGINLLIYFIVFVLPLILIVTLPIWLVALFVRRRARRAVPGVSVTKP